MEDAASWEREPGLGPEPRQASAGSERTALEWAAKRREGRLMDRPGFCSPAGLPICLDHRGQARGSCHRQRQADCGLHPSCPDAHCGVLGESRSFAATNPCDWASPNVVRPAASKHRPLSSRSHPKSPALVPSTCSPSTFPQTLIPWIRDHADHDRHSAMNLSSISQELRPWADHGAERRVGMSMDGTAPISA